jgi:Fe-S cluster assembly protein SufD
MTTLVDFPVKPEARPYLDAALGAAGEPDWLSRHRRRALAGFAERGFPSRRGEAWRYLDLRPLAEAPLAPASSRRVELGGAAAAQLAEIAFSAPAASLVLVDGMFTPALSSIEALPAGVHLRPTQAAIATSSHLVEAALDAFSDDSDHALAALNAAHFTDGFVLEVAPGVELDRPIEIVHLASGGEPTSLHTRSLVKLGAASRVRLIEAFAGEGRYWRNDIAAAELGAGAALARVAIIEEAADAFHLAALSVTLGARAHFDNVILLLGGGRMRQEARVRCAGDGTHCRLYGAFLAGDRQEANILTNVEHSGVGGETRELFKGVAAGRGHGAFQGRIRVEPGAQKTDAHMLSRNLVLGARAAIDTKPELEIFADDVKCSHGAAVGDLDEAALFYLLARGIPRREARHMLIEAFVREAVDFVEPAVVREHLQARLARRLAVLEE